MGEGEVSGNDLVADLGEQVGVCQLEQIEDDVVRASARSRNCK